MNDLDTLEERAYENPAGPTGSLLTAHIIMPGLGNISNS